MYEDEETWKPVTGYPEILVSDLGRVKRVAHQSKDNKPRKERVLKPQRSFGESLRRQSGYIRIKRGDKVHDLCVPELVCSAFFPEYDPDFHQPLHVSGDPLDCSVRNLIIIPKFAAKIANRLGQTAQQ